MTVRGLLLVGCSALLTAMANLLLRGGILQFGEFSLTLGRMKDQLVALCMQPMFIAGVFFYGLAALVWFSVVAIEELSLSYPMLVGLTFILVALGAMLFFHENLSWQRLIGMATILAGIVVVARA